MKKEKEKKAEPTKSDLIWETIKNFPIDMYSLPDQKVLDHVERVKVSKDMVHLKLKSTSVIASLATSLSGKYKMEENVGDYIVVSQLAEKAEKPKPAALQSVVVKVADNE